MRTFAAPITATPKAKARINDDWGGPAVTSVTLLAIARLTKCLKML